MECDPAPREMDKEQPRGDKRKLLRVFRTILMYTYRECNLCVLQMSLGMYGMKS